VNAAVPPLACGNCGEPMQALRLAGHYGQGVEIDLCAPCHLVWFDPVESARLTGPGLLDLIGAMAAAQSLPHRTARPDLHCPRCRGALRQVHNRTRWGRSLQLECVQRHGAWQTFGQFLGEKGLLRAMSSADRARALERDGALHCVNCGGALGPRDSRCRWCASVPAVVDVARLARALDPEAATEGHAVHATGAANAALQCAACGAAQPPDGGWRCVQCGATLTAPALAEAYQQVDALRPALQAHAAKPSPHVVQARLQAQEPALQRQRQRSAEMLAEAEQRLGRQTPERTFDPALPEIGAALQRLPRGWAWAIGLALALLWWWWWP
jgi:Zn-finger nucleic acid-binding protein